MLFYPNNIKNSLRSCRQRLRPLLDMKWAGVNHTEGVMLDENGNIVQKGEN